MATNGTELRLMVPASAVLRSLALVSIDQLLPIYPSLGHGPGCRAATTP